MLKRMRLMTVKVRLYVCGVTDPASQALESSADGIDCDDRLSLELVSLFWLGDWLINGV